MCQVESLPKWQIAGPPVHNQSHLHRCRCAKSRACQNAKGERNLVVARLGERREIDAIKISPSGRRPTFQPSLKNNLLAIDPEPVLRVASDLDGEGAWSLINIKGRTEAPP